MSKFSQKKNRFFLHHRDKGIPHLLLAIAAIRLVVLFVSLADKSGALVNTFYFSAEKILQGQVWRVFTFLFVPTSSAFFAMLEVLFYFFMDRNLEAKMGRLRLNLFMLVSILLLTGTSIVVHLVYTVTIPGYALFAAGGVDYTTFEVIIALDYSLLFAMAATIPDAQLLLFFIIPVKIKYVAWIDLGLIVYSSLQMPFPGFLIYLVPIAVLLLFFWKDVPDLVPDALRYGAKRTQRKAQRVAAAHRQNTGKPPIREIKRDYRHKCTVCGRTDVSHPDLEFRYCSRCSGYYCYCSDHINNHSHIIDSDG